MNINEANELVSKYTSWLKTNIFLRKIEDYVEVTTPYLDRHNDYLQIYVKKTNDNEYILTDDGSVVSDLRMSGCDIDTKKRRQLLSIILNGFGVDLNGDSLTVMATGHDFPKKKHRLLQAMLSVDDMFFTTQIKVFSIFLDQVSSWLEESEIRFTQTVRFSGKSGYDHNFDFVIPSSKSQPERVLRAINKASRDTAESFSLAWIDTRETRKPGSRAFAILNDQENSPPPAVIEALSQYDIYPVVWSRREEAKDILAA